MHPTRSRPASRPEANDAFTILAAVEAFEGERGAELLGEALADRDLSPDERAAFERTCAWIAAQASTLRAQPLVARALATKVPCGSEALAPAALGMLFRGENTGKLVVQVSAAD